MMPRYPAITTLALAAAVSLLIIPPAEAQSRVPTGDVYQVDNAHSLLDFTVRLVGFNRVRGKFNRYRVHMYVVENDITQSSVSFVAWINSVETGVEERDDDLKGTDFFNADSFPVMTFHSERIMRTDNGFVAEGPLTIKGVTRIMRLPFEASAKTVDPFGNQRIFFTGKISLKRKDFGVVGPKFWNNAVSNNVDIEYEMAGRVWGYTKLGWGDRKRQSIGKFLIETTDAEGIEVAREKALALWREHKNDKAYNFGPWEFIKAAGRLSQRGNIEEAATVLELATELANEIGNEAIVAAISSELGGIYVKLGRREDAIRVLQAALKNDPHNTLALAWLNGAR